MPVRRLTSALRVFAASVLVVACVDSHAATMLQPDVTRMIVRAVQPIYARAGAAASGAGGSAVNAGIVRVHHHPLARFGFSALVGLAIVLSVVAYRFRGKPQQPQEPADAPRSDWSPQPVARQPEPIFAQFPPPASGRPAAVLVSEAPLRAPVRYAIEKPNVRIGSDDAGDLVVRDDSVSRRHANIRFESGVLYLSDLGSRGGTYLNGARLLNVAALRPADSIRIGQTEWRVVGVEDVVEDVVVVRGVGEVVERPGP